MASVLRMYSVSTLAQRMSLEFIATSNNREGHRLRRTLGGVGGAVVRAMRRDGAIFHLHVASRWSFARKATIAVVAKLFGHPLVLHVHGALFVEFLERNPVILRLAKFVFGLADRVIALSPARRRELRDVLGGDAIVIPNPVEIGDPPPALDDRREQAVFVGVMDERKGVPDLLRAIALLQRDGHRYRFVLAGAGDVDEINSVIARLPDPTAVTVETWLRPEEVKALLDSSTVFCLPSYGEGVSIALLEAMSRGLVCVTTPVGGTPDVITHPQNGLLVPPGDIDSLAAALRLAFESGPVRDRLAAEARRTVAERYSLDIVADELTRLYEGLARPRTR